MAWIRPFDEVVGDPCKWLGRGGLVGRGDGDDERVRDAAEDVLSDGEGKDD